jgi:hypothetical protein
MSMVARRRDPWLAAGHAQGCRRFENAGNLRFDKCFSFLRLLAMTISAGFRGSSHQGI